MAENECVCVGMLSGGVWDHIYECCRRVYSIRGLAPAITACGGGQPRKEGVRID